MAGRMRMMPLPIFDPGDAPTSTWGGTMIAILKTSPNHEAAWELAKHLYFDPAQPQRAPREDRHPPADHRPSGAGPEFHQPDPFFGGQKIDELYIELARQLPAVYVTPATDAVACCISMTSSAKPRGYAADHGADGLETACQQWLDEASEDLKKRMKQWEF